MKNFDFKEEARFLHTLDPTEYTIAASIVGFLISDGLSINEKNSLGNFIILIGQVLITISAQENLLTNLHHSNTHTDISKRIEDLERQLNELKKTRFNTK